MKRAVCLYLHVHQPYRVRNYTVFDAGRDHNYFLGGEWGSDLNNQWIIHKIAEKSYVPTNYRLLKLLEQHPEFRLSISITGTLLEQLEMWAPQVLTSFQQLIATGRVEVLAETYYHSLAFFFSRFEFEKQVRMHREKIKQLFNVTPRIFRNTELAYNNDLALWAEKAGYKGILAEGWDKILRHRTANHMYQPVGTDTIRLLLKNYKLSDDIAFRFSDKTWAEWPLTAEKFTHWLNALPEDQQLVNLFMDYETFGEHQWDESGIFTFLSKLPGEFMKLSGNTFMTPSEAIEAFEPQDFIDMPETVTWADTERDLSAWLGNAMQQDALDNIYAIEDAVMRTGDTTLIGDWRRLQTSDHFYYMCTKWFNDGDVHAYFNPYPSPYDAFISYMNAMRDIKLRVLQSFEQPAKQEHNEAMGEAD
ncbi:MAG TPA: glycoside hydrolase family 57 protein [Candidatus Acidoferrum sp.]|nr:glycoside hydrolase family 57 protein [Candidatus Acidoferrum sp.]